MCCVDRLKSQPKAEEMLQCNERLFPAKEETWRELEDWLLRADDYRLWGAVHPM